MVISVFKKSFIFYSVKAKVTASEVEVTKAEVLGPSITDIKPERVLCSFGM